MSDFPDWSPTALVLGTPLVTRADSGAFTSGNFDVSNFEYLGLEVVAAVADYRLRTTFDPNVAGFAALDYNVDVRVGQALLHRIPLWTPRVRFQGFSAGGSTADIRIRPLNGGRPYPGSTRADWSLQQASSLLGAGGVQTLFLAAWAGRARIVIRPPAQPYTVLLEALDFQGNLIAELLALTVAAGVKTNEDVWLPPHVNRLTVTDTGAGGTYVSSVTAAPTPSL